MFLPIFSGILLGALFWSGWEFLSFFAFLPLLFYFSKNQQKPFIAGTLLGIFYFSQAGIWFFNILPLNWLGVYSPWRSFILLFSFFVLAVLFSSVFTGAFSALAKKAMEKKTLFLIPALWAAFEFLRIFSYSLIFAGEGSSLGANWTLAALGYSLAGNKYLLPLAEVGGVWLLSFTVVFINVLIFWVFSKIKKEKGRGDILSARKRPLVFLSIVLITILFSGFFVPGKAFSPGGRGEGEERLSVLAIRADFPPRFIINAKEKREREESYRELIKKGLKEEKGADIIVLPEDSRVLEVIKELEVEEETLFIFSGREESGNQANSKVFFTSEKGKIAAIRDKTALIPFGEYLPFLAAPLKWTAPKWSANFKKFRSYSLAEDVFGGSVYYKKGKINFVLCSELLSPAIYRKRAKGASIMVNMASQSFARNSSILDRQVLQISKIRAAESGKFLIRSANGGESFIISPSGEILELLSEGEGFVAMFIPLKNGRSPYHKTGDIVLYISLFTLVLNFSNFKKSEGS